MSSYLSTINNNLIYFTRTNYSSLPMGMAAWYRADAGITLNGSNQVTSWSDLSGNGGSVSITGTVGFTAADSNINNKVAVTLATSNANHFNYSFTSYTGTTSLYLVAKLSTGGASYSAIQPSTGIFPALTIDNLGYYCLNTNWTGRVTDVVANVYQIVRIVGSVTGLNGMQINGGGSTAVWAEIIHYNKSLTTLENSTVINYLQDKYAISTANTKLH